MDITNEPIVGFLILLILLLQSLRFHVELPPSFSTFLLNVVVITNIEEIVIMLICLRHKITCNLGIVAHIAWALGEAKVSDLFCYCRLFEAFDLKAKHALQDVYPSGGASGLCFLQACTRLQFFDL
jgi:hypothetical protein